MRIVRCGFLAVLVTVMFAPLGGCFIADWAAGVQRDKDGKVIVSDAPILTANSILAQIGLAFAGAATPVLGGVVLFYRHKRIIDNGQKDDDYNGIPDDQQKPPTAPA